MFCLGTFKIINVNTLNRRGGTPIHGTNATGENLFCSQDLPETGHLSVDVLHIPPYEQFPVHTHPGHHLLLVLQGVGMVTINGKKYQTNPGDLFLIEADVPHAVEAGSEGQSMLSIGAPHKHLEDHSRMDVV